MEKNFADIREKIDPTSSRRSIVVVVVVQSRLQRAHWGFSTGRPIDLLLGDNVLDPKRQREILQQLDDEDPYLAVVAFPCDPWSPLSNFKDADRKEWEQSEAFRHLQFVRRVCFSQLKRGRHFLLENPLSSQAWKWLVWLNQIPNYSATMHQCQTDLKDHNGDFILKPTRFVTSSPKLALILALKCDRSHEHAAVQGRGQGVSSSLAEWTPFLAQLILRGVKEQMLLEEQCGEPTYEMEENLVFHVDEAEVEAYPSDLRRSAEVVFKENEELVFDEWHQVPQALRSAIVKVHKQYSHALNGESLVRHLRLGGASSSAIKAASLFKCETCEQEARKLTSTSCSSTSIWQVQWMCGSRYLFFYHVWTMFSMLFWWWWTQLHISQ